MRLSNKRQILLFVCAASVAANLFACTKKEAPVVKESALIINGERVSAEVFANQLARRLKTFDALAAKDPNNIRMAKEAVLRELVVSTLLRQFAKEKGLSITDEELNTEFDRVRKTYPDDLTFKAQLAQQGVSITEWRDQLRDTLLEKKAFASLSESAGPATHLENEARQYYNEHRREYARPAQVHLQQIVVTKEDDAERILKKLKTGYSFAELAKRFSVSPDSAKGGDVGYIAHGVVEPFDAAFALKPGQMSGIVKSSYGFHILKVIDKRGPSVKTYDQARDSILKSLAAEREQSAFHTWLEAKTKSAHIERNDELLNKLSVRTEGM